MKRLVFGLLVVFATATTAKAELLTWLSGDVANEADARVALDSSNKGNHAFMEAFTELTDEGRTGGGFDFQDVDGEDNPVNSFMKMNPSTWGRFDGIVENQEFTVAFWMAGEESAVNPDNQSAFWFESPSNNGGARGIQAHIPWSDGNTYFDIAGCCGATQRVSGPIDRDFWDAESGDEWSHWTFTMNELGDAAVYVDGEQVLERFGPTDAIGAFQQVWFGSAVAGGNSFAGRMDDIVVASNGIDIDEAFELFENGPEALWPNDIAESVPTNVLANSEPVAELVKVAGIGNLGELVAGDSVDGFFFEVEVSSDMLDSDHVIKFDGPLDMSSSGIKVVPMGDLVAGDSWVPIFGSEVTGLDATQLLFDDPSLWDTSSFAVDGRVVYTGGAAAAAVPEPTGLVLIGMGGLFVGLLRKQRR